MFNHAPEPAFKQLHREIKMAFDSLLSATIAGDEWLISFRANRLSNLYRQLDVQRALHGLKCEVK